MQTSPAVAADKVAIYLLRAFSSNKRRCHADVSAWALLQAPFGQNRTSIHLWQASTTQLYTRLLSVWRVCALRQVK